MKVALPCETTVFYFNSYLFIFFSPHLSVGCQKLKQLLSFAIGGLLGDVFLHLLPEAWAKAGPSGVPPLHTYHMSSSTIPLTHFSCATHAYSLHRTYFLSTAVVGVNCAACSLVVFRFGPTVYAERGALFSFQL